MLTRDLSRILISAGDRSKPLLGRGNSSPAQFGKSRVLVLPMFIRNVRERERHACHRSMLWSTARNRVHATNFRQGVRRAAIQLCLGRRQARSGASTLNGDPEHPVSALGIQVVHVGGHQPPASISRHFAPSPRPSLPGPSAPPPRLRWGPGVVAAVRLWGVLGRPVVPGWPGCAALLGPFSCLGPSLPSRHHTAPTAGFEPATHGLGNRRSIP